MTAPLVGAVVFICVIMAPMWRLWKADAAVGAAGVLSGGAITYFLRASEGEWMLSLVATLVAGVFYVIGLSKQTDLFYWFAFLVGIFGSLVPVLVGLKQQVDLDTVTIPWGWIILIGLIIALLIYIGVKPKKSQGT